MEKEPSRHSEICLLRAVYCVRCCLVHGKNPCSIFAAPSTWRPQLRCSPALYHKYVVFHPVCPRFSLYCVRVCRRHSVTDKEQERCSRCQPPRHLGAVTRKQTSNRQQQSRYVHPIYHLSPHLLEKPPLLDLGPEYSFMSSDPRSSSTSLLSFSPSRVLVNFAATTRKEGRQANRRLKSAHGLDPWPPHLAP